MRYSLKKTDSPLYVISDLHLGSGRRDNFSELQRVKQLIGLLDHIESEGSQLVVLGDFIDLWRFGLGAIIKSHPDILSRFSDIDCVYVPGNHDLAITDVPEGIRAEFAIFNKISEPFGIDINGKNFVFCHGHEVDNLNRYIKPSLGRLLGCLAMTVEQVVARQVFDSDNIRALLFEVEAAIVASWSVLWCGFNRFVTESLTVRQMAVEMLKHKHNVKTISKYKDYLEKSHTVVNAHTHRAGNFKDCYYNSGSWALGNSDFLRIIPDGVVEVLKWTKNGISPNCNLLA
jgi:UDP-2,3-diacylglucosamine pyrophosphatase LpxH